MSNSDVDIKVPGGSKAPEGPIAKIFEGDFSSALDETYPWPEADDDQIDKTERILSDIRDNLFPIVDPDLIERKAQVPIEVIHKMSELDLFGLKIPESLGGEGLGQFGYNKVLALLGSYSSPLSAYVSAHNSLGAVYPLIHYGTEKQKSRLLPGVSSWPTGFCFTEKEVGSDPASMRAFAVRVRNDDGKVVGYRLNAKKWYTTNALRADYLAVVANAVDEPPEDPQEVEKCFCIFLVRRDSEGVSIGEPNNFAEMNGIDNANPEFNDVFVPLRNRIGDEGQGFNIALEALNTGRIAVAAITSSSIRHSFEISRWWANIRDQQGLIGEHELIQEKISKMAANLYAVESLVDFAANRSDQGLDTGLEAAIAKVLATELGWDSVDDLMQVRGGRGYETKESLSRKEYGPTVERIWRDLRVTRIFEGTTEVLSLWSVARGLYPYMTLGLKAMKGGVWDKASAGAGLMKRLIKSVKPNRIDFSDFPEELHPFLDYGEIASRKLVRLIVFSSLKYQGKLQYKQLLIRRMFWISARILSIALVSSRAAHNDTKKDLEIAKMYCRIAKADAERLFDESYNLFGLFENDVDYHVRPFAKKILSGEISPSDSNIFIPKELS